MSLFSCRTTAPALLANFESAVAASIQAKSKKRKSKVLRRHLRFRCRPTRDDNQVDVAKLPSRAEGLAASTSTRLSPSGGALVDRLFAFLVGADGKRDGENRLVSHEGRGEVWGWSAAAAEWQLVGYNADELSSRRCEFERTSRDDRRAANKPAKAATTIKR